MSSDKIPTCNQCGAEISWNKTVRDNFGIKGPLEPDETKKHTCDEERKKAYKANKAAEELATKDAREKAAAMGGGGNGNQQLTANEVFLKGMLEEQRRQTDLLVRIAASIENAEFYLRKLDNSHEWFEKLLETRYRDDELPPRKEITTKAAEPQQKTTEEEEITGGGVQEQ
jgi:hypothetical protein